MARPKSTIPTYRKHRSGQARVTINGRDYYLGLHGTKASKQKYDRLIAEYLVSGRSPTFGATSDQIVIASVMNAYRIHAKQYYGLGPSSEWHRIKQAYKPLKALYASLNASEFGPNEFKAVRQSMVDAGRSRSGTNAQMKRILRMFKWAASEGMLAASVYETLRLIPSLKRNRTEARETDPVRPVDPEIVEQTIAHMTPIVADMVRVQLLIGCRPAEVCKLTSAMIDRSGEVWIARLDEHKTAHHERERNLYIGPRAQKILMPYLLRGEHQNLFRPCDAVKQRRDQASANLTTPLSCGNRPGKRSGGLKGRKARRQPSESYDTAAYRRAIHYACDRAFPPESELKGEALRQWRSDHRWSPNRLRHTRGTEVRNKFGLEHAQVYLGHAAADVTQVYAERDQAKAVEVARKIG